MRTNSSPAAVAAAAMPLAIAGFAAAPFTFVSSGRLPSSGGSAHLYTRVTTP